LLNAMQGESKASWAVAPDDTIAWVDHGFDELAIEHGVPELTESAIGRPLLDFVAGDGPRELQDHLLRRARRSEDPIQFLYRCDAPGVRRMGRMELAAQPGGGVIFTSVFDEVEQRTPPIALLDPDAPRSPDGGAAVRECAWCNRFDVGGWREADDAMARLANEPLPHVEHSVCDVCRMLLTGKPA
jgi:hypothetical protein